MRLKKEDGRSKVKVLSLSFSLSPTNFQIVFGCYKTAEPDLSLSLICHMEKTFVWKTGEKERKKKRGAPLHVTKLGSKRRPAPKVVCSIRCIGLPPYTHAVCVCVCVLYFISPRIFRDYRPRAHTIKG